VTGDPIAAAALAAAEIADRGAKVSLQRQIARLQAKFEETSDPMFAWAAVRYWARGQLVGFPMPEWLLFYLMESSDRLISEIHNQEHKGEDQGQVIAHMLGFETGRGKNPFKGAHYLRDLEIYEAVNEMSGWMPEKQAKEEVAKKFRLSSSSVSRIVSEQLQEEGTKPPPIDIDVIIEEFTK
jgi:hypothetical protein